MGAGSMFSSGDGSRVVPSADSFSWKAEAMLVPADICLG